MSKTSHLALSGPPGVGKTTYIQRLVKSLKEKEISCFGFVTEEVRNSKKERIGFDVITLDGKRGQLARTNSENTLGRVSSPYIVGKYIVDVRGFETVCLPLFSQIPKSSVIIIDEIGKMELFSSKFVQKVKELITLSNNYHLIVTIPIAKGRPIPLVEEIRNHKSFRVEAITRTNRNDQRMFDDLLNYFVSSL